MVYHRADTLAYRVLRQDTVYIGIDKVWIAGHVEPGVHGVCLGSTVDLVDHTEVNVLLIGRQEHSLERLGEYALPIVIRHLYQVKVVYHLLERRVLTAVVHDDDLKLGIVLRKQRLDVVHDGVLLVVSRSHNGHARSKGRVLKDLLYVGIGHDMAVALLLAVRQQREYHVAYHQCHRVEEHQVTVCIEQYLFHAIDFL